MSNLFENDSSGNNPSENDVSDGKNKSAATLAATLESAFEERIQKALRESTESLDGYTQSRLTQARYAAVDATKQTSWSAALRRWLSMHWIAPAGGATAAAILAIVLAYNPSQQAPDASRATATLDDLDMVASGDSLELYQEMDFYAWLDSQHSDDWSPPAETPADEGAKNIT